MTDAARMWIGGFAVAASIASALLWFWAATVRVPWAFFGTYGGPGSSVIQVLNKQANINRWAAALTGLSALLQTVLLLR